MKLLMHTCCAPCSVYCIDELRGEEIEPTLYWFNPNIHPYMEYKQRRDCLKEYAKKININAIFEEDYGLREFCKNTVNSLDTRCQDYCYPVRLIQTAKYAKQNGYDAITTTLLVSPYQKHEVIYELGDKIAKDYGIQFLYRDFRVGFRSGQAKAREMGLYMQKYCGCIFSEEDRYYCQKKENKKMDKFIVIKVMNESMLRLKKEKKENYERNEKIREFLADEALFFKIKKEVALKILMEVGVRNEKLEETYQELIKKSIYENLIIKGKINLEKDNLIIKYN